MENIDHILSENQKLISDLDLQLNETRDVIESIKKGNIDALLLVHNKTARIFVSKTSDESYRKFIENMTEGVVTIHIDGTILYSNYSFARIIGTPLEKITGSKFSDYLSPAFIVPFQKLLIDLPGEKAKMELPFLNHSSPESFFLLSLNKLVVKDLITFNLVLTDISDLKKTEDKLKVIIEGLKIGIDKQRLSEIEIVKLNYCLKESKDALEDANIKLANISNSYFKKP